MPKGDTFSCLQYVSALAVFHLLHENRQVIDISCVLFPEARSSFKVPGYRPSDFDKKLLIWTGRFKRKEDIPEQVSFEMIDAARNKVRVKACYGMIILSIVACIGMVILGKDAAGRHENLTAQNMEKKARYREEARKEREAAAIDKSQ
ncbi:UNVERIFIED_CONTAM: hypothetical protein FKN15_012937 [Acipenser sinensis]